MKKEEWGPVEVVKLPRMTLGGYTDEEIKKMIERGEMEVDVAMCYECLNDRGPVPWSLFAAITLAVFMASGVVYSNGNGTTLIIAVVGAFAWSAVAAQVFMNWRDGR